MKVRFLKIGALVLVASLIGMTAGCSLFEDKFVGVGRQLFLYHCSDCHGESGQGNGYNAEFLEMNPRNLTDSEEKYVGDLTNENIYAALTRDLKDPAEDDPVLLPLMPTFKNILSEAELWSIVAYVRTLQSNSAPKITLTKEMKRKRPKLPRIKSVDIDPEKLKDPEFIETGQELFEDTYGCVTCHSIGGEGGRIGPPLDRAGFMSNADWLYRWVKNPQSIAPHTKMPALGLSDEDAMAVVAYVKTLQAPRDVFKAAAKKSEDSPEDSEDKAKE